MLCGELFVTQHIISLVSVLIVDDEVGTIMSCCLARGIFPKMYTGYSAVMLSQLTINFNASFLPLGHMILGQR